MLGADHENFLRAKGSAETAGLGQRRGMSFLVSFVSGREDFVLGFFDCRELNWLRFGLRCYGLGLIRA